MFLLHGTELLQLAQNDKKGCIHTRKVKKFFGVVCFHTALFASEPEILNKTTRVLRSSIHWTEILKQGKEASAKTGDHGDLL